MMKALLEAHQLTKIHKPQQPDQVTALAGIDLRVDRGEVVALTGPSGSGKTTLLGLLAGMARPTSGSVMFDGRELSRLPERFLAAIRRENFGFIFQQYNLLRDLSVQENVMLPLYATDQGWRAMSRAVREVLERFGMERHRRRKIRQLSGGEQQRVAIARALVGRPQVIIADEPTAHLDGDLTAELLRHLAALAEEGRTVLIATHDPLVYQAGLIQRSVHLRDGCLVHGGGRA